MKMVTGFEPADSRQHLGLEGERYTDCATSLQLMDHFINHIQPRLKDRRILHDSSYLRHIVIRQIWGEIFLIQNC
jgi:hypothetical protein